MEDTEFFDRALQLQDPWFVRGVKLDLEDNNAVVRRFGIQRQALKYHRPGLELHSTGCLSDRRLLSPWPYRAAVRRL